MLLSMREVFESLDAIITDVVNGINKQLIVIIINFNFILSLFFIIYFYHTLFFIFLNHLFCSELINGFPSRWRWGFYVLSAAIFH